MYACWGEKDKAIIWLELALDNRDASLLEILNESQFKSLFGDPPWNPFSNKVGLPKDHDFNLD
ncbi:hypothetical protein [Arenibacter echinorum]|uniref:hypothetical protein n=1 Tax=Arenibacter echinorum TaxID=440515 RepID=UPI003742AC0E